MSRITDAQAGPDFFDGGPEAAEKRVASRDERRPRLLVDQSRSEALTGIIGARRACTVSMISPLSMPCR